MEKWSLGELSRRRSILRESCSQGSVFRNVSVGELSRWAIVLQSLLGDLWCSSSEYHKEIFGTFVAQNSSGQVLLELGLLGKMFLTNFPVCFNLCSSFSCNFMPRNDCSALHGVNPN